MKIFSPADRGRLGKPASLALLILCLAAFRQGQSEGVRNRGMHSFCNAGIKGRSLYATSETHATLLSAAAASSAAPKEAPPGMALIPGGRFWMGTKQMADAQPVHLVEVSGF